MRNRIYKIFWFYTQFWLPAEKRRPYTFLMRDIYHRFPLIVITLGSITLYLIGRYTASVSIWWLLISIVVLFTGEVLGHCFWGKKYIEGQQEDPPYLGEDNG